jgi:hypothetical protein
MRAVFFILFLIGWTMVISGYVNSYQSCPPQGVQYRYVPRTVLNEQLTQNNDSVSALYDKMVSYRDPLS